MPIFTFNGADEAMVREYFKRVGELAQISNIDVEQFVFINGNSTIIGNGYESDAIYVTIDWIGRPLKQDPVANHILEFFSAQSKNVYVKFTEINTFLYHNGEQIN
jgi:hypothetical protein